MCIHGTFGKCWGDVIFGGGGGVVLLESCVFEPSVLGSTNTLVAFFFDPVRISPGPSRAINVGDVSEGLVFASDHVTSSKTIDPGEISRPGSWARSTRIFTFSSKLCSLLLLLIFFLFFSCSKL